MLGLWALIGLGIGILIPNQVAALLIGIGVAWIVEPLLGFAMSYWEFGREHVAQFLPSSATNAVINAVQNSPDEVRLDWWAAALVLAGYATLLAGFGIWRTTRADISLTGPAASATTAGVPPRRTGRRAVSGPLVVRRCAAPSAGIGSTGTHPSRADEPRKRRILRGRAVPVQRPPDLLRTERVAGRRAVRAVPEGQEQRRQGLVGLLQDYEPGRPPTVAAPRATVAASTPTASRGGTAPRLRADHRLGHHHPGHPDDQGPDHGRRPRTRPDGTGPAPPRRPRPGPGRPGAQPAPAAPQAKKAAASPPGAARFRRPQAA